MSQPPYSIPSREEILGILRTAADPQTLASIAKALSVKDVELDGLTRRLAAMERDGQIKPDRKGRIQLANTANFTEGRVSAHRDGYGFLIPDDGDDIFLPEKELQKVPFFVRGKARRNTERFAAERGLTLITVETLYDAKAHYSR